MDLDEAIETRMTSSRISPEWGQDDGYKVY